MTLAPAPERIEASPRPWKLGRFAGIIEDETGRPVANTQGYYNNTDTTCREVNDANAQHIITAVNEYDTAIRERDAARDAVKLLRGALEALRQVTIPPQDISGRRMYDGAVEALAATASIPPPIEQEPPA